MESLSLFVANCGKEPLKKNEQHEKNIYILPHIYLWPAQIIHQNLISTPINVHTLWGVKYKYSYLAQTKLLNIIVIPLSLQRIVPQKSQLHKVLVHDIFGRGRSRPSFHLFVC